MKIIHLSDLHFGTQIPGLVERLTDDIRTINPDFIIVSGDVTQRAHVSQFLAAQSFFNDIGKEKILCVPGNHDISLYNLTERLFYPFKKYQKYINSMVCSTYTDDQMAIVGINSVTPFKAMSGYVTQKQLELVANFFQNIPDSTIKIVVMHHNLIRSQRHSIINDAEKIINMFAASRVNLVLSGHIHYPCIEILKRDYISHNMYVITAGTAISHRTTAPNSYNVIEFGEKEFKLVVREFQGDGVVTSSEKLFIY